MLVYHPAQDPYHAAFRLTRIIAHAEMDHFFADQLRILDFFLLYPSFLREIKFPQELKRWRSKVETAQNPYHVTGNALTLFTRLRPVQAAGLGLLVGSGFITGSGPEPVSVKFNPSTKSVLDVVALARDRNSSGDDLVVLEFIARKLAKLPFFGRKGLKARTGLLEFRYDSI